MERSPGCTGTAQARLSPSAFLVRVVGFQRYVDEAVQGFPLDTGHAARRGPHEIARLTHLVMRRVAASLAARMTIAANVPSGDDEVKARLLLMGPKRQSAGVGDKSASVGKPDVARAGLNRRF
jgi:hypothetical protein